jgi:hypothetical protein
VCGASGKAIQPGDEFIAVLVDRPGDDEAALQRIDFSLPAWQKGARPKRPLQVVGYWRTKMHPPGQSRKPLIDDAALLDLFEQLDGVEEPSRISFRFVLALILIRKKLLKYEGSHRDAAGTGPVMLVRRATRASEPPAEVVEVCDPQMDEAAVGEAVEQLSAIMAGAGQKAG